MPNPPRVTWRRGAKPPNEPWLNVLILVAVLLLFGVTLWAGCHEMA